MGQTEPGSNPAFARILTTSEDTPTGYGFLCKLTNLSRPQFSHFKWVRENYYKDSVIYFCG